MSQTQGQKTQNRKIVKRLEIKPRKILKRFQVFGSPLKPCLNRPESSHASCILNGSTSHLVDSALK